MLRRGTNDFAGWTRHKPMRSMDRRVKPGGDDAGVTV
jgi:hypothetical protein